MIKTLLLILALAVSVSAQTVKYDKFTGATVRTSKFIQVANGVSMMAEGRLPKDQYNLVFEVQSGDWQFIRQCKIYLLADSEPSELTCRRYKSSANAAYRRAVVTEIVFIPMTGEAFKKIFSAKDIQFRVGSQEFQLKEKHVEELKKALPD